MCAVLWPLHKTLSKINISISISPGYSCVYKRRTGTKTDGCAVCYKAQRFTQLSVSLLEFQHNDRKLLDRDNVGIVLLLQPTTDRTEGVTFGPICVANTHLLFNPSRGDIKLAQLAIVLAEIDKVVKQCRVKGHDCQSILCGDLNSIPHMPLYELIITGRLYFHGMPTWMVCFNSFFLLFRNIEVCLPCGGHDYNAFGERFWSAHRVSYLLLSVCITSVISAGQTDLASVTLKVLRVLAKVYLGKP